MRRVAEERHAAGAPAIDRIPHEQPIAADVLGLRGTDDRGADTGSSVGDAARRGANKVVDAVDNVKDRIDGNPASKPGPDPTDRRL